MSTVYYRITANNSQEKDKYGYDFWAAGYDHNFFETEEQAWECVEDLIEAFPVGSGDQLDADWDVVACEMDDEARECFGYDTK